MNQINGIFTNAGKFVLKTGGSQTYTSDIDFNVDFKPDSTIEYKKVIAIVGRFISIYNSFFTSYHKVSSLEELDVNLYANDGHHGIINDLVSFKNDPSQIDEFRQYSRANRVAGLLLCNDAFRSFNTYLVANNSPQRDNFLKFNNGFNIKLDKLITDSGKCGEKLIYSYTDATNRTHQTRDLDISKRNDDMEHSLLFFSLSSNHYDAFCNMLAANYHANEAYCSYGSIWEMTTLQPIMDRTKLSDEAKSAVVHLNSEELMDSILMNFAYGVENAFERGGYHKSKFGKYISRLARVVAMWNDKLGNTEKKCFKIAFKDYLGIDLHAISYFNSELKKTIDVDPSVVDKAAAIASKELRNKLGATANEQSANKFVRHCITCFEEYNKDVFQENAKKQKKNKALNKLANNPWILKNKSSRGAAPGPLGSK